jgi:hypothetical protein
MITYAILFFSAFLNVLSYYMVHRMKTQIAQEIKDNSNFTNRIKKIKVTVLPKGSYKNRASSNAMKEFLNEIPEKSVQDKEGGIL